MNAKIQDWFRGVGAAFLSLIVPDRTKRAIFLASFFARVNDSPERVDMETLVKLNRAMSLVKRDDSLGLAVQLNRAIWHGMSSRELCLDELNQQEMSSVRLRLVCTKVMENMPAWLRYGDEPTIRGDLIQLFSTRAKVLAS